jgi:nucleoside-diphosphate-sugar epimerase
MKRVLITGAAGRIGTPFRERYGDRYNLRFAAMDSAGIVDHTLDAV